MLPGSIPFLIITFLVGLILLQFQKTRLWGRRWLWVLFISYVCFSLPLTSRLMAVPLVWGHTPILSVEEARGANAIVVLDSETLRYQHRDGNLLELPGKVSVLRALEAVRVYQLLGGPLVIVSGGGAGEPHWSPEGTALRDVLVRLGVPAPQIVLDSTSPYTRAHAVNLVNIMQEYGITDIILVTSPTHMRRAVAAFRLVGIDPIPSPSASLIDDKQAWEIFLPSAGALLHTQHVMHDYLGLVYYRISGWI